MEQACVGCDLKQMDKVSTLLHLTKEQEQIIKANANEYLMQCDRRKTNPEIMGELWKQTVCLLEMEDPYREVKREFNEFLMQMEEEIFERIKKKDSFLYTIKTMIIGNLIDFAAKHQFSKDLLLEQLDKANDLALQVDDTEQLEQALCKAKTVLVLGDNCGEIVLDKIGIMYFKQKFPNVKFFYGVRGSAIVNDVTIEDALQTGMARIATVIDNGDGALGTVLEHTSQEFKQCFHEADVVIAKGQGNYEGLLQEKKDHLFFLFMAKCEVVADPLKIPVMSIVCLENRNHIDF